MQSRAQYLVEEYGGWRGACIILAGRTTITVMLNNRLFLDFNVKMSHYEAKSLVKWLRYQPIEQVRMVLTPIYHGILLQYGLFGCHTQSILEIN